MVEEEEDEEEEDEEEEEEEWGDGDEVECVDPGAHGYDIAAEFVAVIGAGATPGSRLAEAASLAEAIGPGPKPGPKRIARYKKWYEQ